MKILNCTQHRATAEQISAGVVDLDDATRSKLTELLTFNEVPGMSDLNDRSVAVARLIAPIYRATGADAAMIGGAPFFMTSLESALLGESMRPVYAFSRRESVETVDADGAVKKTSVFRHAGFVEV